ncbi:MazG nucleotide pyrophosphohydrolase domain-containing protein [Fluviispira multicolorata]|uniref:NTP pyrophosphohydrolase MazG putative catalytic core domain-containing protein n=1 Tax=Fluviispira multicolorata TaxID=2654512 RepID=A0A833JER5_9BACT|nr:MazG nucleotide pyrophosphohydrolase domain-containing protein [Fluviispira multicolorata]KAB8032044.1 hypothetical protein GCL57_05190 [Fluviispira multicolorata]
MKSRIIEPNIKGLAEIQSEFDKYQNCAFEQREASFFSLELCGECGELANLEKKIWRDPSEVIDLDKLADEAADVFIALTNYCNARKINLEASVQNKLKRIEDRRLAGKMGKTK